MLFVLPVFRLLSSLLTCLWMISSYKCGTGWDQHPPTPPASQASPWPSLILNPEENPFDPMSRELFLQGASPNYKTTIPDSIRTVKTIKKAPEGTDMVARCGGDFHPDTQILQALAPLLPLPQEGPLNKCLSMENVPHSSSNKPITQFCPLWEYTGKSLLRVTKSWGSWSLNLWTGSL